MAVKFAQQCQTLRNLKLQFESSEVDIWAIFRRDQQVYLTMLNGQVVQAIDAHEILHCYFKLEKSKYKKMGGHHVIVFQYVALPWPSLLKRGETPCGKNTRLSQIMAFIKKKF